jgi:ABC-type branched-subunit amino acid transport system substrate-binding protein
MSYNSLMSVAEALAQVASSGSEPTRENIREMLVRSDFSAEAASREPVRFTPETGEANTQV